jgi:hypothetical protein
VPPAGTCEPEDAAVVPALEPAGALPSGPPAPVLADVVVPLLAPAPGEELDEPALAEEPLQPGPQSPAVPVVTVVDDRRPPATAGIVVAVPAAGTTVVAGALGATAVGPEAVPPPEAVIRWRSGVPEAGRAPPFGPVWEGGEIGG